MNLRTGGPDDSPHNLRQQSEKSADQFNKSLSDFITPKETGLKDYIGALRCHNWH